MVLKQVKITINCGLNLKNRILCETLKYYARNYDVESPLAKSMTTIEKVRRLLEVVGTKDTLAILINADPDAIASAMALKRLFWRRAKKVEIYRINKVDRADNLTLIKLLNIKNKHVRMIKKSSITKWALVDSQPHHNDAFSSYHFDIIIDHHPMTDSVEADFIDIRDDYGANTTILTEYFKAAKIKPSPRLATAMFYGIKTDTDNFLRHSVSADMIAFRYLYEYTNMNIIKKIESSEITAKTLSEFAFAIKNLSISNHTAFVHMDRVENPDSLVIIADFFMKLAEVTWSICSGVYDDKLIVCIRNAGFRKDAGKFARDSFGDIGTAGGHTNMARAEIPLDNIKSIKRHTPIDLRQFVHTKLVKNIRSKV
jgi:nanoRNase/pAp phosphatase (c-di-AMP/oligoRNAs hydrolase)